MHAPTFVQLVVGTLAASSAVSCYQPAVGHSALSTRHAVLIMGLAGSAWGAPTRKNTALEARKPKFPGGRPLTERTDLPLYVPHSAHNTFEARTPRGPGGAGAGAQTGGANANVNANANNANNVNANNANNRVVNAAANTAANGAGNVNTVNNANTANANTANANTANVNTANVNTANANTVNANTVNNANPPTNRNRPGPNRRRARVYVPRGGQKASPTYASPLRRAEDAKGRYPHVVRHV